MSDLTPQTVADFLASYEQAQATHDFDEVAPLIHPEALFRFNDGDYRGIDEIRSAFEATWALDIEDTSYRVEDLTVETAGPDHAAASFSFVWEGTGPDGRFEVRGRGTTVVVMLEDSPRILIEHLSR